MPLDPSAADDDRIPHRRGHDLHGRRDPESRRAAMIAAVANPDYPKHQIHDVRDRTIPGPAGEIPVRVFTPTAEPNLPLLLWFHGGGWVTGNLDTHDQLGRTLSDEAGAIIVSVDYRLAPENKFPAALDDCVAAYEWALAHAGEVGGDPRRIAIGGDSAGGNLAAVVALVAREKGLPQPKLQLLVYPVADYELSSQAMVENASGYFLEAESMRWFYNHYAQTEADFDDWRFSPLRADDHSGLRAGGGDHRRVRPAARPGRVVRQAVASRGCSDRGRARRRLDPRVLRDARVHAAGQGVVGRVDRGARARRSREPASSSADPL